MPYSKSHKINTRRRILKNAYRLFIENGYEATTIKQIMEASELTHGAFYAHFSSKKQLFTFAILKSGSPTKDFEDLQNFRLDFATPLNSIENYEINVGENNEIDSQNLTFTSKFFRDEAVKNDPTLRSAYTRAFKILCRKMRDDNSSNSLGSNYKDTVLPVAAMLVGAETIAQTVDDFEMRDTLIESCKRQAELLVQGINIPIRNNYFWDLTDSSY